MLAILVAHTDTHARTHTRPIQSNQRSGQVLTSHIHIHIYRYNIYTDHSFAT